MSAVSLATVVAVAPGSPAEVGGVAPGDELVSIGGRPLRDVIEFRVLSDEPEVELELRRGGLEMSVEITKDHGEPLGLEVDSPVFDEVRTCDNHCEFCFIHQLPPGLRKSLYLKDDDYRLSFLYGNFTTLTRFTEADLERVLIEGLSPLYVSIHATDPEVRVEMLRNRRGAMSLRWLRALLDHGVEVATTCCGSFSRPSRSNAMAGCPALTTLRIGLPLASCCAACAFHKSCRRRSTSAEFAR